MKKNILIAVLVIIGLVAFVKAFAYAQNMHLDAKVSKIDGNTISFIITENGEYRGHVYEWTKEENEEPYMMSEDVTLDIFDFEDSNKENDVIVAVRR